MHQHYVSRLNKWLNDNIHFYAGELVSDLIDKKIINAEHYDNVFIISDDPEETLEIHGFTHVYQWFVVSKNAYFSFKKLGDPVIKYKEMYIWGRTCEGQPIIMDYHNDINKMQELLKNSITDY